MTSKRHVKRWERNCFLLPSELKKNRDESRSIQYKEQSSVSLLTDGVSWVPACIHCCFTLKSLVLGHSLPWKAIQGWIVKWLHWESVAISLCESQSLKRGRYLQDFRQAIKLDKALDEAEVQFPADPSAWLMVKNLSSTSILHVSWMVINCDERILGFQFIFRRYGQQLDYHYP